MKRPTEISLQVQQHINILFCLHLGHTLKKTRQMMNLAYRTSTLSYSQIQFWFKAFSTRRISVVDLPRAAKTRTGHSEENIQTVHNVLAVDRCLTIAAMSDFTGIKPGNI